MLSASPFLSLRLSANRGFMLQWGMEKRFSWKQEGREKLELTLTLDGDAINNVTMNCVGCLDFLEFSQDMKKQLQGSVKDLKPPQQNDHSSMIWREVILQIQEQWDLPVKQEELCHCRKVSTKRVDRSIVYGAHNMEEIRKRTSANTGCGTCKQDVEDLIHYRMA